MPIRHPPVDNDVYYLARNFLESDSKTSGYTFTEADVEKLAAELQTDIELFIQDLELRKAQTKGQPQ